jgi:single-stranded DNA-binding protein
MRTSVNEWVGEGYIANELLLRHTTDSVRPVTNFILLIDIPYKAKKNQEETVVKKRVEKIPVTAWSGVAENICNSLAKGDKVRLKGAIRTKLIQDSNNLTHSSFEIIASEATLLSRKTANENKKSQ